MRTKACRSMVGTHDTTVVVAVVVALIVGLVSLVLPPPVASASSTEPHGSQHRSDRFLLALGDSISFGFQGSKVTDPPDPARFTTGYVDVLGGRDRSLDIHNYGCPGETTTTFINGECPWRLSGLALHEAYGGSQLTAALAFLRANRNRTGTITLALWGNDILALSSACGGDLGCVSVKAPAAIDAFTRSLRTILRSLRSAAPSADIAVLAATHAFPPPSPEIDGLYNALNAAVAHTTTTARARFADTRAVFNPSEESARATAICRYTLACATSGADAHPSDSGYVVIADAFTAAAPKLRPCVRGH